MEHSHGNDNKTLSRNMPDVRDCERVAEAFSQLGDGTRLRILWLLCHSEQCVLGIADTIGMSAPAVAHHLRLLKGAGLLQNRRVGREMRYRLGDSEECKAIHEAIDSLFHVNCPGFSHHD